MIGPQLWAGMSPLQQELFQPARNQPEIGHKGARGLWTSTYDPAIGSHWLQWAYTEQNLGRPKPDLWLLTPKADANVYTIDSYHDLQQLLAQYEVTEHPLKELGLKIFALIDFEAMAAAGIDGIHLTRSGEAVTRWSMPSLYGWDVESTYWMHWAFEQAEPLAWHTVWEPREWKTLWDSKGATDNETSSDS